MMTDNQIALFEQGFAAYADDPNSAAPKALDAKSRRWWLKGWHASRDDNWLLRTAAELEGARQP